uniref:Uncharacterized protein n=1 Tax=Oryza rufipogon TaxID=4529 RepID=A0A0G2KBQ5_ORYRU
MCVTCLTSVG